MKRLLLLTFLLTFAATTRAQNGAYVSPAASTGGSGNSATSVGPVINVTNPAYAGGASSANADNNAQFTSAAAAYNAATNAAATGSPSVGTPVTATNFTAGGTSVVVTVTIPAGSTNFVWVSAGIAVQTFTVSDSGGSVYTQQDNQYTNANTGTMYLFATGPGQAKASTSVTVNAGASNGYTAIVASYPSVVLAQTPLNATGGAGTSFTTSRTTTRGSSAYAVGCQFFNSNVASISATTGNLRISTSSAVGATGNFEMDNSSTPIGSVTNAGTFSASTFSNCIGIELQSNGLSTQKPTLYIPAGYYFYSGGLTLTNPGTLKCETGAVLNYTGSAHAVDLGPTGGLSRALAIYGPFIVDGCEFTGGNSMTQGITFNPFILSGGVRNSFLHNFGPVSTGASSPWMIAGMNDNFDIEIGPQNRIVTDDLIPRNVLRMNINAIDEFSFLRFHDNQMYCLNGPADSNVGAAGGGCLAANAGIGIWTDSHQNLIMMNSLAFFNPDVVLACTAGPCVETMVDGNIINPAQFNAATAGNSPLQFDGSQQGLVIHNNRFSMGNNSASPIGPRTGTGSLNASRINFNTADLISAATPFVAMNNVVAQSANQSSNNLCNASAAGNGSFSICAIPHTIGANITSYAFNNDDLHLSYGYAVNGTTFTASGCGNTALTGGASAGTYQSVTAGACTITITMGNALTAAHGWVCDAHDITTAADANNITMGSSTTTTANLVEGTVAANDIVSFKCVGY